MKLSHEPELFTLPSGGTIDIARPNFAACVSEEDWLETRLALQERIIDIEMQIDLYEQGCLAKDDPSWLPRAKAALKWTKLYRSECQDRQGYFTTKRKRTALNSVERNCVNLLKEILPPEHFAALIRAANAISEKMSEAA